jgi:tetratricopeptide (TPR) repeat protein
MPARFSLLLLLLLGGATLASAEDAAPAQPASESEVPKAPEPAAPVGDSMAEARLKDISEHQKVLFSDAVAQGSNLDTPEFTTQTEQLVREYESLLRDNPKFAAGYASYGYMLWKIGMRKPAVAILLKANQLDPDIPLVKNELGNYLAEEGKPLEALNYFLSAVKLDPNEPLYHYQLGTLLFEGRDDFIRSGQWTRASLDHSMLEAFRHASELAPTRVEFSLRYAEAFFDMVDPDWTLALKTWQGLEAKAQSDPERDTMRLQEAHVYFRMGKPAEAHKVLDSITDPKLDELKQKLIAEVQSDKGK